MIEYILRKLVDDGRKVLVLSDRRDHLKNIKETFRQHEEFQDMDEDAIRQKFNSMDSVSICKIARFLFGWIVKLFKAPLSYMDKQLRGGMGGKNYKRSKAWPCR